MDWTRFPDLIAVALLAWAFASVARRSHAPVPVHWLTAWALIAVHFAAFMFVPAPGVAGTIALTVGLVSLVGAGLLFMRAAVPYRKENTSRLMLIVMLSVYIFYVWVLVPEGPLWLLNLAAILVGAGPLVLALAAMRRFNHPLRWLTVALSCGLALVLLQMQNRPGDNSDAALNAVFFTVYLGCTLHVWYMYRRATAGAIISIAGFFAWANVFTIAPFMAAHFSHVHIESEVWNLPKYVVAVGMILILLEDQIAHNKHLALHDELTGLPNRRLFLDRLSNAVERARRANSQMALLTLDLDHFKQVNDTLGHHVGDLLLQHVANLFSARVRRSDTVARTGGDEFAVILEAPTNGVEATQVGRALLDLLAPTMSLEGHQVHVGASLGIAIFPDDAPDMDALCITADLRMYDNKRSHGSVAEPRNPHDPMPPVPPPSAKPSRRTRLSL